MQLNFGARSGFAPKIQSRPDLLRPFADSGQPPVSGARTFLEYFRVRPLSIIADTQAQQAIIVPNLGFDLTCIRVPESISYHLASNPVDFVLKDRGQGSPRPLYRDTEVRRITPRIVRARQFLTHRRQQVCEIVLSGWRGS
jgi:hypothetical protein